MYRLGLLFMRRTGLHLREAMGGVTVTEFLASLGYMQVNNTIYAPVHNPRSAAGQSPAAGATHVLTPPGPTLPPLAAAAEAPRAVLAPIERPRFDDDEDADRPQPPALAVAAEPPLVDLVRAEP
jgi:hypothetical protein